LKALEARGAKVDHEKETAKFPRKMIEEFIAEVKKEDKSKWEEAIRGENRKTLYSGYVPPIQSPPKFKAPYLPYVFHPLATFFYDDENGEKRRGNKEDFMFLTKLGDVLSPEDGAGHSLILSDSDVSPLTEPLEAALLLLEYSHKPRGVYVEDIRQINYLKEIEEIAGIKDPYWHWMANISFATPLKLGKDIADRFVYMIKSGDYPAKVYTMAVSGVNMPVTTAGGAVLTAAEFIALWISARSLNPKIPLTGLALTGTMNMGTGEVNYWTFNSLIQRLTICEFIRKWLDVSLSPGIGEFSPARLPGFYSTLEKAYLAMTIAAFTGHHPELGIGHLEGGLTISPVQLLLDREFSDGMKFLESPVISKEAIGLETILEVGLGVKGNYLDTEHTLKNFRSSTWNPEIFDTSGWTPEKEGKALKKAKEKVKQLVSEYKKPDVDLSKISRIRRVIEKARKNL
jgi:trimethylamine:corrinoid methyltransferase-like protein